MSGRGAVYTGDTRHLSLGGALKEPDARHQATAGSRGAAMSKLPK
jgi:hypothetical protein